MTDIISIQGLPFLACLIMLAILGYIGIHVLKREIIFIDIALAQIAAVGAIAAHVLFHFHGHSIRAHALSLGSTLIAAAFFAIVRRKVVQIPLEAVIGVSYAVSAAGALFLVGVSPGGHVHVHEMLAGSILWATWSDVLWSAGVFAVVGLCFYVFRNPFRTISERYEEAVSHGYKTLGWDFLFYALVGVVITMAVRIAGVVVVFTFLIIPATLSAAFSSTWSGRLLIAWVAGAVSTALGLLFADRFDFSVGPAIALFLGAALVVVALLRLARLARVATASVWLAMAAVMGVWFASGATSGRSGPVGGTGGLPSTGSMTHSHAHGVDGGHNHGAAEDAEGDEIDAGLLSTITEAEKIASFYERAAGADERSAVVCRMLEVDVEAGARMAFEFLETDPPLLFRMTIVDKVEEVTRREFPYEIDRPFAASSNREAVAGLKESLGLE
jgi:zinc/manganese transport system permease protein